MPFGHLSVLSPKIADYIADDSTTWEQAPLRKLATNDQLRAFRHRGFWQPMDTLRDKHYLEELWSSGKAAWRIWK